MNQTINAEIFPGSSSGEISIPPSKSFSHRAILCAALAQGESHISNVAFSEDIRATIACVKQLGAQVQKNGDTLLINGVGFRSVIERNVTEHMVIDCNESGSTLRFLIPVFALSGKHCRFTGKGRLMQRPQEVYAHIFAGQKKDFLVSESFIETFDSLEAGVFTVNGNISSQFISGLLFALPLLDGDSIIKIEPPFASRSYVNLTLEMLRQFGIETVWLNDYALMIKGNQIYSPQTYRVEGDYSQLAFFAVLAAVNHDLTLTDVNPISRQGDRAILDILKAFGASVQPVRNGWRVQHAPLTAHTIDLEDCPDLGPVLMVLAALSTGTTVIHNAGRLRLKESDRIAAMETELRKVGVEISSSQNTVTIQGGLRQKEPTVFDGHNDHRVVMSLAVLASVLPNPSLIRGADAINKSYPDFFNDLRRLGISADYPAPAKRK